eukprot:365545-Chlamydomonas_euryale.AAC.8
MLLQRSQSALDALRLLSDHSGPSLLPGLASGSGSGTGLRRHKFGISMCIRHFPCTAQAPALLRHRCRALTHDESMLFKSAGGTRGALQSTTPRLAAVVVVERVLHRSH